MHNYRTRTSPGRDRMVVGFTTICAISAYHYIAINVVSSNPAHGEVYLIQHYVESLSMTGGTLLVFYGNCGCLHQETS